MAKKKLADVEITVDEVRKRHRALIARRMVGPGDSEGAMHRIEAEFGLGYWEQWNFQYKRERAPRQSFLERLRQAMFVALQNDVRRQLNELETTAARVNALVPDVEDLQRKAHAQLAETKALLAQMDRALKERAA